MGFSHFNNLEQSGYVVGVKLKAFLEQLLERNTLSLDGFGLLHLGEIFECQPSIFGVETFREGVMGSRLKVEVHCWEFDFALGVVLFDDGSSGSLLGSLVNVLKLSLKGIVSIGSDCCKVLLSGHVYLYIMETKRKYIKDILMETLTTRHKPTPIN